MKIVQRYDITFRGGESDLQRPSYETFWVEDDKGVRTQVSIPNNAQVIKAFRWLNDNDMLRLLESVEPVFSSNMDEISEARYFNDMMTENAYASRGFINDIDPVTFMPRAKVPGLRPIPAMEWTATWSLWSREHAVMFKLACGGQGAH